VNPLLDISSFAIHIIPVEKLNIFLTDARKKATKYIKHGT
jgi:hypothetical protein